MSRRWKIFLWIGVSTAVTCTAIFAIGAKAISRHARDWVDDWLTEQYKSQVDLESFQVSVAFPLVQAEGANLVLHFHGRRDLPPLIAINHFTLRASFLGFLGNPRRIQYVHLDGLQINIPPREANTSGDMSGIKKAMGKFRDIRFGEIVSDNAKLEILTNKPGKKPLELTSGDLICIPLRPAVNSCFGQRLQILHLRETFFRTGPSARGAETLPA